MDSKNLFENTDYLYEEVFPNSCNKNDFLSEFENFLQLNWNLTKAFYNSNEDEEIKQTNQQFIDFNLHGIRTNNYVGIIKFKNLKIVFYPKVFKQNENDKDPNSELSKLFLINLREWAFYYLKYHSPQFLKVNGNIDQPEDIFKDLFISIFTKYLLNALNKRGYFKYEDKIEDLPYITGRFDVQDYLCKKYPNGLLTQFKCSYSSFEFDNLLNQIIKYTCKKLIKETQDDDNKLALRKILAKLSEVSSREFHYQDCEKVKIDKMYSDYQIILWMCKMFLLNLSPSYDNDNDQSFCFLFPSELLFEGFISGFLLEHFSGNNAKIKLQANTKYLVDSIILNEKTISNKVFKMRYDILVEMFNKKYILDTKYKSMDSFAGENEEQIIENIKINIKQADLYQLITYAIKENTDRVYLIYPNYYGDEFSDEIPILKCSNNSGIDINIGIIKVPYIFLSEDNIKKQELKLFEIFSRILYFKD